MRNNSFLMNALTPKEETTMTEEKKRQEKNRKENKEEFASVPWDCDTPFTQSRYNP